MKKPLKKIIVVAAIIINDDRILCVQRGWNKYDYISEKFEFPGGKVEPSETEKEALKREIQEELSLPIKIKDKFLTVDHIYPHFQLQMHSYICSSDSRNISLNEHIAFKWLEKSELNQLDWAAADLPIVEKLNRL